MKNQEKYIEKIRDSYITREHTKLDDLKELDKKVKLFPSVFAYISGSLAALILGAGMCFAMQVIGTPLMSPAMSMTVGVIVGCVGIILCIANYCAYKAILKARKKKYGSQIVAISNELLNQKD